MPVLNLMAAAPHGRYLTGEIERVLGWHPQDRLDIAWYRQLPHVPMRLHRLDHLGLWSGGFGRTHPGR